jgi:hypothetical protein
VLTLQLVAPVHDFHKKFQAEDMMMVAISSDISNPVLFIPSLSLLSPKNRVEMVQVLQLFSF